MDAAVETMVAYRSQFIAPLVAVNNLLRRHCRTLGLESEVTQRLKKANTILDKLTRESGLDLSRMQDIGGCRVVVASLSDLRRLESRLKVVFGQVIHHSKDYIEEPRESGYRAVHIIVERDGRLIEVQLRTQLMHRWAETVEAFSALTASNFKRDGDHLVQEFMKVTSALYAFREAGERPPVSLFDRAATLSNEVSTYLAQLQSELERTE